MPQDTLPREVKEESIMATEYGNSNALNDANLKLHPITIAG